MAWTDAQEKAMNQRNRTLLVSAAAGSGKTAVLTQRIIRILTQEHGDISRLLVVTFTRAAAGELRHRISEALSAELALDPKNTHLSRQLMLLGGAHISTIDSFYYDLVRTHFQAAGFPPSFRLADDTELAPLRREVMNDTIDALYRQEPEFGLVSDIFCGIRWESALSEALIDIVQKLNKYPESIDILLRSAEEIEEGAHVPLKTKFGQIWQHAVVEHAKAGQELFSKALDALHHESEALSKRLSPLYTELYDRCQAVLAAAEQHDYEAIRLAISAPLVHSTGKGGYPTMSETFGVLRQLCAEFRDRWVKKVAPLGAYCTDEISETATESAKILRLLHKALQQYEESYRAQKLQREIAEFSDVSRAAFHLLVSKDGSPTPLAREISNAFDAIYIDEYQDVDAMQDGTFRAIAKPDNRFMVGDIKQSIYRFRGAQPAVFANYRKTFPLIDEAPAEAKEAMIFMSDCFRCDKNIIDFSNTVSGYLFAHSADSIGYTQADDLHFKKERDDTFYSEPKCRVMILNRSDKEDEEESTPASRAEARMIANEIAQLLTTGRKADGSPIVPKDIAILMRSTALAKPLSEALAAWGIPTNNTSQRSFFENPEVLCMYSLLATIDNPFRDIYLAATLRSPFFGFDLEDLVTIRSAGDASLSLYEALLQVATSAEILPTLSNKIVDFTTRLGTYREKAQHLSVDKLLRYLYRETAVLAFAGYEEQENGTILRQSNLRRLYEYARHFEASGFKGLYQFIRYVDSIMESGATMPAPEGDPNAVSLITIHHSKGLQFPVCFVAGTASPFNQDDTKPQLLSDEYLGCAIRLCNAGPFSRTDTFFRQAVALEITRQNREEEMRVLYVAMTRAQERLYVTGTPRGDAARLCKRAALHADHDAAPFATSGSSLLEWILTALEHNGSYGGFAEITVMDEDEVNAAFAARAELTTAKEALTAPADADAADNKAENEVRTLLQERFSFTYPYLHLTRLPAKLSVSRLSPVVLDVFDNDASPLPAEIDEADTDRLLHTFDRTPCFGTKEISAAEKGTATHEFLQFCDFKRAEQNGVEAELARLIAERYLPPETKDAVRLHELQGFFKSDFYRSLSHADQLYRETRFHIFLPAAQFTDNPLFAEKLKDEKLTVQGVIDLFFTDKDGKLILCDYKTDRLTTEQRQNPEKAAHMLGERHGEQLSYYALALAEICGKRPDKILIYSLPLGAAVEIEPKF